MSLAEQRFMAAADALSFVGRELAPLLRRMHAWQAELAGLLDRQSLDPAGLRPGSPLAGQARAIAAAAQACRQAWPGQWAALAPAHSLADAFEDRVMLLMFGKFNAGKSSLCNLLASRFRARGRTARGFRLENGRIVQSEALFDEGPTETTAGLQGVCLGEKVVLLDTPGLHSVTAANAALTQRLIGSADAVLWLTSSTSPGQVQELDELARELRRRKPLLPIITRSDWFEEDEVDGELVNCLRNKTVGNRALQEADVQGRARDRLASLGIDPALLRSPVSVSAHMARRSGPADVVMAEAGFDRLYDALQALVAPALGYKQRKPAEVLLHHLQEQALGDLNDRVGPALAGLREALLAEGEALAGRESLIGLGAWRSVVPELPALVEDCLDAEAAQDGRAVWQAAWAVVSRWIDAAVGLQLGEHLGSYELSCVAPADAVGSGIGTGAETGAETGTGSGTGSGNIDGAPDHERLHAALEKAVRGVVAQQAARAVEHCRAILDRLDLDAQRLQVGLSQAGQQLDGIAACCRVDGDSR